MRLYLGTVRAANDDALGDSVRRHLAIGGKAGTITVFDIAGNTKTMKLPGHTDGVGRLAFSPDGKLLASGGWEDHQIFLWNAASGTMAAKMVNDLPDSLCGGNVVSLAFSRDGKILASGHYGSMIRLWDGATGKVICTLEDDRGDSWRYVAFSPDSKLLASGNLYEKTVTLWDISKRKKVATLDHDFYLSSVAFSPDGQTLASGSSDKTVKLWNVATALKHAKPK